MTYLIHTYEPEKGWSFSKESKNLDDFNRDDKWAFNFILTEGSEYVEMGNTMWTIEKD